MTKVKINDILTQQLSQLNAKDRVSKAIELYGENIAVTTSFGIQSAAFLHLVTSIKKDIKVIWVDAGYCFKETYYFAENMIRMFNLNIYIAQSDVSPARMEALHGKLWEKGSKGILKYNHIRKKKTLEEALSSLGLNSWMSAVRSHQTLHRSKLSYAMTDNSRDRIYPLLDWNNRDVHSYLKYFDLPYHPLYEKNYLTVGDWHTSRPVSIDDYSERDTRFGRKIEECGIHL